MPLRFSVGCVHAWWTCLARKAAGLFYAFLQFLRVKFVNSHGKKTAKKASILQQSRYNIQEQNNAALRAACAAKPSLYWKGRSLHNVSDEMGLEKPGGLPKAICFRAVFHRAHLYDGARQFRFDGADHGYRLYARAAGRQRYAGALEPPRVPRLAADRLHALPHLVPLSVDYYIRNVLAETAFQAAP